MGIDAPVCALGFSAAHKPGSRRWLHACGAGLGLLCLGLQTPAFAQVPPDAGALQRQIDQQREQQNKLPLPSAPASAPSAHIRPATGPTLIIKRFAFEGNERYTQAQLSALIASYTERRVTLADVELAAADIARYYRAAGWVARVIVPPQQVDAGVIRLKVVEGVLGETRFSEGSDEATLPVKPGVIVGNVQSRQAPGDKMNIPAVERGLLLADDIPGIGVNGSQVTGKDEGATDILLDVSRRGSYFGEASLDNLGSRGTGQTRAMLRVGANSPFHIGDQFDALLQVTPYMQYLRVSGAVPLGSDGLRLSANAATLNYRVGTPEFASLAPRGDSRNFGTDLLYPLIRATERNVYVGMGAEYKRPYNTATTGVVSDYDISDVSVKIDANLFDSIGAGGITAMNLTQVFGHVNLDDSPAAYIANDAATAGVAGEFRVLRYRLTRTQRLSPELTLLAAYSGQHANKDLDSAEKFYLGGPYGVRAYPSNEAGGSQGRMLNLDLRWRLPSPGVWGYELSVFYDWGHIDNAFMTPPTPNAYSLGGWGFGLAMQGPYQTRLSAVVARRLGDNPGANRLTGKDQDGSLDRTRFWLTAGVSF